MNIAPHPANPEFSRRRWISVTAVGLLWASPMLSFPIPARAIDEPVLKGRIYAYARNEIEAPDQANGLITIDPNTGRWSPVSGVRMLYPTRVSPDGRYVAYKTTDPVTTKTAIWVLKLGAKTEPVRVFDSSGGICWSPDSQRLIVSAGQRSPGPGVGRIRNEIWQMKPDGSERVKLPIPETESVHDYSPDGRWLLTFSARERNAATEKYNPLGPFHVYLMHPDDTGERLLFGSDKSPDPEPGRSTGRLGGPRFAPDGQRIAYATLSTDGMHDLWISDLEGNNRRRIVEGTKEKSPGEACWSLDGKWLACVFMDRGRPREAPSSGEILIVDTDGGNRRSILVGTPRSLVVCDWRKEPGE